MLIHERRVPDDVQDGAALVVLLHGRGSDEHDLAGLQVALPADAILVTPRAPFPGTPWGYGGGWAWYRFVGGRTPDPVSFEAGQAELERFMRELPGSLPVRTGPLILGGFSQGGTSALAFALRNPGAVDGVAVFSGFLADHPSVQATPATAGGRPVFWGHGTADEVIPHQMGVHGRRVLSDAGAAVTSHDAPIGHAIDAAELRAFKGWCAAVTATGGREPLEREAAHAG